MNSKTMQENKNSLRDTMYEMLSQCTELQQELFGMMYNPECKHARHVDGVCDDQMDNAFSQIERTMAKNASFRESSYDKSNGGA